MGTAYSYSVSCGYANAATVFAVFTLVFEGIGIIFAIVNVIIPGKPIIIPFKKWFLIGQMGTYFGNFLFISIHFAIRNARVTISTIEKYTTYQDHRCAFAINRALAKEFKPKYGNGYTPYWGYVVLFIVDILGVVICAIYMTPFSRKILFFSYIYYAISFVHLGLIWITYITLSVIRAPDNYGPWRLNISSCVTDPYSYTLMSEEGQLIYMQMCNKSTEPTPALNPPAICPLNNLVTFARPAFKRSKDPCGNTNNSGSGLNNNSRPLDEREDACRQWFDWYGETDKKDWILQGGCVTTVDGRARGARDKEIRQTSVKLKLGGPYLLLWRHPTNYIWHGKLKVTAGFVEPKKWRQEIGFDARPWFFNYELTFFIFMNLMYVGFILTQFDFEFK